MPRCSRPPEPTMDWNLQQLRKSSTDRHLDGICGGLGEYTPVPSWMWRVAFVALCFAGGAGAVAYLILSLLMPKAGSAGAAARMPARTGST